VKICPAYLSAPTAKSRFRDKEFLMAVTNDLDEIKGIGPQHEETLKSIGVDSIKELWHATRPT
jgi:predicted flap endonuclease-1-like 5' DNA nuclease